MLGRSFVIGILSALVSGGLLFAFYPWSTYRNFSFPLEITLASYITPALFVGGISAVAFKISRGDCWLIGLFVVCVLCATSILLGPFGLDVAGLRIRGIFFAEWEFVRFMTEVALPVAAFDVGIAALYRRRRFQSK